MQSEFEDWIGRSASRRDSVTARLLAEFRVVLSPHLFATANDVAPPGFHFGLAPALHVAAELGDDGAEPRGGFMPPLPFAHRMWAGGVIETLGVLREGQRVLRRSTIVGIRRQEGRSGTFYVVEVLHEIEADGLLAVRERQDLVYREAVRSFVPKESVDLAADLVWHIDADALMLFRYSAFTFNGHRIHYDVDFARQQEGHEGVLVHGPLQATLLLNQLSVLRGGVPRRMSYRCIAQLPAPQRFRAESWRSEAGTEARIVSQAGVVTCQAQAA